jgi:hypothetical protein
MNVHAPLTSEGQPRRVRLVFTLGLILCAGLVSGFWLRGRGYASFGVLGLFRRPVTFYADIAPLVYTQCAVCHHAGGAAPFSLLTFEEVRKHGVQIEQVTRTGYMPPWPPAHGYGDFENERRLTARQVGVIQQWFREGMAEGDTRQRPPVPAWPEGWLLGKPDQVVTIPQAYQLAADGKDVYRNFVIRAPVSQRRYVRGIEFHPGNLNVAHHAFIKVDHTSQSRQMDGRDHQPGFPGMNTSAEMPDGQFLTWQPGKLPEFSPAGLAWTLRPGDDIVVQMHLRPSGKVETVQPSLALYFTDQPPAARCFKIVLTSLTVDVPAGERAYAVNDSFELPVDVDAVAVLPHAHYLAKRMEGWAMLPGGEKQWMLLIRDWDFNWQGDYRYARPVFLPKGTTLFMRFTYDNSTNNVRNPNQPPKRVTYGPQSSDEMAELWFQLLPRRGSDLATLASAYQAKMMRTFVAREEYLLSLNPADAKAHLNLGSLLLGQNRAQEAQPHLRKACELNPSDDQAHYWLGLFFRRQDRLAEARSEFETALLLNPRNYKAHGNLGLVAAAQGDRATAESHLREALRINPEDTLARQSLEELLQIEKSRQSQAP